MGFSNYENLMGSKDGDTSEDLLELLSSLILHHFVIFTIDHIIIELFLCLEEFEHFLGLRGGQSTRTGFASEILPFVVPLPSLGITLP